MNWKTILLSGTALAFATAATARDVEDYSETIAEFKKASTVAPYFDSAYGYAVFPTIGKGGLGIGGARGHGQVYRNGQVTGHATVTELSVGLQAGGQAYSEVIFFEDKRAYDDFTAGNFEFSAEASAIAVTASASAESSTQGSAAGANVAGSSSAQAAPDYYKGMLVFTMGKGGLMYAATIAGQKYKFKPLDES